MIHNYIIPVRIEKILLNCTLNILNLNFFSKDITKIKINKIFTIKY